MWPLKLEHPLAVSSALIIAILTGLTQDLFVALLAPFGAEQLALWVLLLLCTVVCLLAWLTPYALDARKYKAALNLYNPNHFIDLQRERDFDEFAAKIDREKNRPQ